MSSKFEHCPLNDCTSMVNNADNIMSSGSAKFAKAKSLPSAFLRKKNNSLARSNDKFHKSDKADELPENAKAVCNESVMSVKSPKRNICREMRSECRAEDMHMMHTPEKYQSSSNEKRKEMHKHKEQPSQEEELIFQHDSPEQDVGNCCNVVMDDGKVLSETKKEICKEEEEEEIRQVDYLQFANYHNETNCYYTQNNNSIVDNDNGVNDAHVSNRITNTDHEVNNINDYVSEVNNGNFAVESNRCQYYEYEQKEHQNDKDDDKSNTNPFINAEAEAAASPSSTTTPAAMLMALTTTTTDNETFDTLSSTPTPVHRSTVARHTRPLVEPLQRIPETPWRDGCHNPYSPSLLLDECACVAESSFYSCYSDSAETQRETDSCGSPDRWHHRCSDFTPTTSQSITPTTTRAPTVSTLLRGPLSERATRGGSMDGISMSAHYLLHGAPSPQQHLFPSQPSHTQDGTPHSISCYGHESGAQEHKNSLHLMNTEADSIAMTEEPLVQPPNEHNSCTHTSVDHDTRCGTYPIEYNDTEANKLQHEREQAKWYHTTEYNRQQLLQPRISISAETDYASADLFTPYRTTQERAAWEPLHAENLSMTNNGVSRRLMWPSPLSPLSPSPSPTKATASAITSHYTQLNDPFSVSQHRSSDTSLNSTPNMINNSFINTIANTNNNNYNNNVSSMSVSPTSTMVTLKSTSRPSVTLHETVRSSHSHQPATRVLKTIVQCGVDRSSGRPIPLRR